MAQVGILDILKASPNMKIELTSSNMLELVEEIVSRLKAESSHEPEEGFYTIEDLMKIYSIKARSTLYKWNKIGYLPCEKVGKKVVYKKALVHRVLGSPKYL